MRQQRGDHRRQAGRDRGHRQRDAGDEQRVERLAADQAEQHDEHQRDRRRSTAMIFESASSCFCSGVLSVSVLASMSAMWPISVSMPVAVTIISPRPRVTEVFM